MEVLDLYNLRIKQIIDKFGFYMLKNPNIVGVARGNKVINGKITNIPTLVFYVVKKLGKFSINNCDLIPQSIKGVSTDVIESGHFKLLGHNENNNSNILPNANENRPAVGGGCVYFDDKNNPEMQYIGTLAAAVTEKDAKTNIYFLTSGHLFRKVGNKDTTHIKYMKDTSFFSKSWEIGKISKISEPSFSEILDAPAYEIDAAIGLVGPNNGVTRVAKLRPGLINGKIITQTQSATKGDKVYKYGQSTGLTTGVVDAINGIIQSPTPEGMRFSTNQIIANQACQGGDSGALGVIESTGKAFGVLTSGSSQRVTYSDINAVMKYFNIEFLK